ncbi:MAG: hybrid sensor histidine kinase/response regulator, partial [Comamonadaceae bacterium]
MNDMSPDHSVEGASLEQRVLREHLATVYASHTSAIAAHLGFAVVLLFFVWPYLAAGSRSSILSWFVLVAVVDTYVLMAKRWTPAVPVADSPYWARKYTVLVTLASLATAPACFVLMSSGSPEVTTVVTVVILGSWTRAVQARWSIKPAMFGYAIPMMSGLILALLWTGGGVHWLLAAFAAVNLLLTLRAGVQQNQRLTESLILRFENEALASSLKEQIAISERVSAEKTRFLAAASHDLRQPMHAGTQ